MYWVLAFKCVLGPCQFDCRILANLFLSLANPH